MSLPHRVTLVRLLGQEPFRLDGSGRPQFLDGESFNLNTYHGFVRRGEIERTGDAYRVSKTAIERRQPKAYPTRSRYALDGVPGLVQRRKARSTGAIIGVYHAEQAGLDECRSAVDPKGLPWATVCETHDHAVNHRSLQEAKGHACEPEFWCEGCMRLSTT